MTSRRTLVKPPPLDETKAPIENALELTELGIIAPDLFTNTRELWHPPGARGLYGGCVIAQTLAAAQRTVPPDFVVHSYHCFFVLAGNAEIPILYHVERVREGRSFCTRTVQARQRGHCIFTVTCSFAREGAGGAATVAHAAAMPRGVVPPPDVDYAEEEPTSDSSSPFQSVILPAPAGDAAAPPEGRRTRLWVRARGRISAAGGHQAHLSALAYISDSYFIGTVARIHGLLLRQQPKQPQQQQHNAEEARPGPGPGPLDEDGPGRPRLGMMVSLDHSIYFHNPKQVRADEWMFTEMESPWAGDGRGVVMQKIFSQDGTLLATAVQEGVVRLKQDDPERSKL
ncbi:Thioesterase/thiol ester dehydrase-isomerase [Xylariaceae sp. FL0804]|nr:Thioesterase/thiol ester dehydrase-isomerase [Xylariaceae sp. FL0804]